MAAIYSTASKEGVDINSVFQLNTTNPDYPAPPFVPGDVAWGSDGSSWVYSTASVTIQAGAIVLFSMTAGSWSVAQLTSALGLTKLGQLVGVLGGTTGTMNVPAPSGNVTGCYFWVQRAGLIPKLLTAASTNANVKLHSSAVAGLVGASVQSTSVQIDGLVFSQTAAASATGYTAVANWPTIGINDV